MPRRNGVRGSGGINQEPTQAPGGPLAVPADGSVPAGGAVPADGPVAADRPDHRRARPAVAFRRLLPRRGRRRASVAATSGGQRSARRRLAAAWSPAIAGGVFARLTVLPAVLILAWLIPGVPLLLAGDFSPVPMLLISVPLAVALAVNGLRVVPASWPRLLPGNRTGEAGWTVWFGLLATVAIVAGLIAWQLAEASQAVIGQRDPGTYLQAGYWIANHGSLPIPETLTAFGGAHPGLRFATAGFLTRGTSLYPAAAPGMPMLVAGAFWVHGIGSATALGPLLGGLATLTFAGLAGRLAGPQWAPAGALVLGLSLPQQYVSRTSLGEAALQIMLFGGLCLLVDSLALRRRRPSVGTETTAAAHATAGADPAAGTGPTGGTGADPAAGTGPTGGTGADPAAGTDTAVLPAPVLAAPSRRPATLRLLGKLRAAVASGRLASLGAPPNFLALLAGLSLGFGLVISLTGLLYLVAVIPFGCALVLADRPRAATFLFGSGLGVIYGLLGCYLLDRPFLDSVGETVALAEVVAVWVIALSVGAILLSKLGRVRRAVPAALARRPLRWLPGLGVLLALAVLIGFAVRPYVQHVHGHPDLAEYRFVESLQRLQGLRIDPTRVYSEQTLYWIIWYVGLPTVLLGAAGLAIVVRRCLRALLTWRDPVGVWRIWGLPLAVICASVAVLWAPDIAPDQPWASRRLIVMAIPGLIIFALWAGSWLSRRARDRGARPATAGVAGAFCVAAMLVPTVATTFGLGLSHIGKYGGLQPVAQGLAQSRTGAGESTAVTSMCARIPGNASVVVVERAEASKFAQVIRGMCGVPVAWVAGRSASQVDDFVGAIARSGRRPLLLAGSRAALARFGGAPQQVLDLSTTEEPHQLIQLPTAVQHVHYQVWMTVPAVPGAGA